MKTVLMDILALGITAGESMSYNTATHRGISIRKPITQAEIDKFINNDLDGMIQDFYDKARGALARGGFFFDESFFTKWHYKTVDPYHFNVYVTINWVDYDDIGKQAFMGYIKQTGFMDVSYKILKAYS